MTEKLTNQPETAESLLEAPEQHELLTAHASAPETEKNPAVAVLEARQEIQRVATDSNAVEQLQAAEAAAAPVQPSVINRQLKQITLRRELKQLQRKETPAERALSRLMHQPVVRTVSEAASQTVSRPSGLLGGSLTAFMGTSAYLYLSKHFGFQYNYLMFLLLLATGFIFGLLLELMVHLATANQRHYD
jgi:hypothetical protein